MITRATESDSPALVELVNSAYRGETSRKGWTTEADLFNGPRITLEEMIKLFHDPAQMVFKYADGGTLQGCVALRKNANKLYLGMLTVNPLLQGNGIGKKLLEKADDVAIEENCFLIFMTVITIRKDILRWYERHGYADSGKRMPFHKNDARIDTATVAIELAVLEKKISI